MERKKDVVVGKRKEVCTGIRNLFDDSGADRIFTLVAIIRAEGRKG